MKVFSRFLLVFVLFTSGAFAATSRDATINASSRADASRATVRTMTGTQQNTKTTVNRAKTESSRAISVTNDSGTTRRALSLSANRGRFGTIYGVRPVSASTSGLIGLTIDSSLQNKYPNLATYVALSGNNNTLFFKPNNNQFPSLVSLVSNMKSNGISFEGIKNSNNELVVDENGAPVSGKTVSGGGTYTVSASAQYAPPEVVTPQCTRDSDCGSGGNYQCQNGQCVVSSGAPPASTDLGTIFVDGEAVPAKFEVTISGTTTPVFFLRPEGTFYVDWGDGTTEKVTRSFADENYAPRITHTYPSASADYTIKFGGQATRYMYNRRVSGGGANIYGTLGGNVDMVSGGTMEFADIAVSRKRCYVKSVRGSLGAIFPTLTVSGKIQQPGFGSTFVNCQNLTSVPSTLFDGIYGQPGEGMFLNTFSNSGLISVPERLFGNLSGTPTKNLFASTFYKCKDLVEVPDNLFNRVISGAPAENLFSGTFSECTSLQNIPEKLFDNMSGAPATNMFDGTFRYCSNITSIPPTLFKKIKGAPADGMFKYTFDSCSGLTSLPDGLFSEINGAPAYAMYASTFADCTGLTGNIPENLFGTINGPAAPSMYSWVFSGDRGLTGTIPTELFGTLSGQQQSDMFRGTFQGCSGLTGYIPAQIFWNISNEYDEGSRLFDVNTTVNNAFSGCSRLAKSCPSGTRQWWTGYEDYWGDGQVACVTNDVAPECSTNSDCGGAGTCMNGSCKCYAYANKSNGKCNCIPNSTANPSTQSCGCNPGFAFHTIRDADEGYCGCEDEESFVVDGTCIKQKIQIRGGSLGTNQEYSISISAKGTFYLDWGDGTTQKIVKNDTTMVDYTHTYTNGWYATQPIIRMAGTATEYAYAEYDPNQDDVSHYYGTDYQNDKTAAIRFNFRLMYIEKGSLGAIFPSYGPNPGQVPNFIGTFRAGLDEIKEGVDLFDGVTHATPHMFASTFASYYDLYHVPENLFSHINGTAPHMFDGTFSNTYLRDIPENLFNNIQNATWQPYLFTATFHNCQKLETLPANLFSSFSGTPSIGTFYSTFGSSGLTSVPAGLFNSVHGTAAKLFDMTFAWCHDLVTIPAGLFAGVTGASQYIFGGTFVDCDKLSSIPNNLFGDMTGAPALGMFSQTFQNCSNLSGPIPEYLFGHMEGQMRMSMFDRTFSGCSKLSGQIPDYLFWGLGGTIEDSAFRGTFEKCSNLTGFIPPHLFAPNIDFSQPCAYQHSLGGAGCMYLMYGVFSGCDKLASTSTGCPSGYKQYITGYEQHFDYLGEYGDNGRAISCEPE